MSQHRLSCAGAEWQEPLPLPTHQNGWATPNRFGPLLDGRDGRPSIRPERLLRGCCCRRSTRCQNNTNSRWAIDARTVASCGRCRLLDTRSPTITGRSAVILRQHTTPFRPMIVPLMIWSLSSKLEKLEPSHTRKFPRVNAQNSKLGPIQPWDVKDFLRPDRGGDEPRLRQRLGGALHKLSSRQD